MSKSRRTQKIITSSSGEDEEEPTDDTEPVKNNDVEESPETCGVSSQDVDADMVSEGSIEEMTVSRSKGMHLVRESKCF